MQLVESTAFMRGGGLPALDNAASSEIDVRRPQSECALHSESVGHHLALQCVDQSVTLRVYDQPPDMPRALP